MNATKPIIYKCPTQSRKKTNNYLRNNITLRVKQSNYNSFKKGAEDISKLYIMLEEQETSELDSAIATLKRLSSR